MADVAAGPPEIDAFLRALTGLTSLRVCNAVPSLKMPPMHCLAEMRLLRVRLSLVLSSTLFASCLVGMALWLDAPSAGTPEVMGSLKGRW
jgi:hypothetical protein